MKDLFGKNVEISGWTQYGNGKAEISVLEIRVGSSETRIRVEMSSDEMVAWCNSHGHPVTDMRDKYAADDGVRRCGDCDAPKPECECV